MLLVSDGSVNISQGALVSIVISVLGFVGVLITLLHKNMTEKVENATKSMKEGFQSIHTDLKPLTVKIEIHEERINELRKDHTDLVIKLDNHGKELSKLQHRVDTWSHDKH